MGVVGTSKAALWEHRWNSLLEANVLGNSGDVEVELILGHDGH